MNTRLLSVGAVLAALAFSVQAESPPPFVGTWKLNLAKSKYSPGPAPKSVVQKHEAVSDGLKQVTDGIDSDGKPFHDEYTASFDGKEYPVVTSPGDTIAIKRVDPYTYDWTWRRGGRVLSAGRAVYSRDGKVRTLKFKIRNFEKANVTAVYDRM